MLPDLLIISLASHPEFQLFCENMSNLVCLKDVVFSLLELAHADLSTFDIWTMILNCLTQKTLMMERSFLGKGLKRICVGI